MVIVGWPHPRGTTTTRRRIGAAVAVLPILIFLFLRIVSPNASGWFAANIVGRITDPIVFLSLALSFIVGAIDMSLIWPVLFAIAAAGIHILGAMGFRVGYERLPDRAIVQPPRPGEDQTDHDGIPHEQCIYKTLTNNRSYNLGLRIDATLAPRSP